MRALVIGRGSMGKRRIRDLTTLGVEVESWDNTDSSPLSRDPFDAVIVSTPPERHELYVNPDVPTFTEADVETFAARHIPSATPLFTDWYQILKKDKALAYTLHVGQHLDDWHPGADKSTYYAYQGDVAIREMIPFELIWLTKMFGPVRKTSGRIETRWAQLIAIHESGVTGHITIDTLSRPPVRLFTTAGENWKRRKRSVLTYSESAYLEEMRALVAAVKGEQPWPYSQAEEAANLEVLRMIERSD